MNFCSQSFRIDFSVWSCSHLGCVDLCSATLLCLWFLCSILSVRQVTNPALLSRSISLHLSVLLIFSSSSVGKLLVNNCIPSWPGVFQFDIFLSVDLSKSVCISDFGPYSSPSSSLVILFIHSEFSLCFFCCLILVQNLWEVFCTRLLVCFSVISSELLIKNVLECPVLSVLV